MSESFSEAPQFERQEPGDSEVLYVQNPVEVIVEKEEPVAIEHTDEVVPTPVVEATAPEPVIEEKVHLQVALTDDELATLPLALTEQSLHNDAVNLTARRAA